MCRIMSPVYSWLPAKPLDQFLTMCTHFHAHAHAIFTHPTKQLPSVADCDTLEIDLRAS